MNVVVRYSKYAAVNSRITDRILKKYSRCDKNFNVKVTECYRFRQKIHIVHADTADSCLQRQK